MGCGRDPRRGQEAGKGIDIEASRARAAPFCKSGFSDEAAAGAKKKLEGVGARGPIVRV